ncbi:MAG: prolyl oligopeptidase family serine peptidase [Planctomycetaceae bacterium]|nr:prolyl oligopeptidase family serine peptidase [Planctomycetaceae bacterium]
MIQTQCDGCFREYKLDDKYAGKTIRCKDCGKPFKVETPGAALVEDVFDEAPARSKAPAPRATSGRKPAGKAKKQTASSGSKAWIWVLVGGGALVVLLVCGGGAIAFLSGVRKAFETASTPDVPLGDPDQLFPIADVPTPEFPSLGAPMGVVGMSGVQVYYVDFGLIPANSDEPGMRMKMRVYVPPGEHAAQSLGCVLVAPAGTILLTGNDMDNGDYHDETLPYAEAGMVVVFYSLDGGAPDTETIDERFRDAYLRFRRARAGVINGRNALDYVLKTLPQVDPQRIFSAGHSSAATHSLLLAAHEPRLRGCLAYAPATDVEERLKEMTDQPGVSFVFPGVEDFVHQSSPKTHAARINCPVFLFHARDDSNEPFETTEAFAGLLQSSGKNCTFSIAESGDHYNSMIEEGIPRGIEWLSTMQPAAPAQEAGTAETSDAAE